MSQVSVETLQARLNLVNRSIEMLAGELNGKRNECKQIEQEITMLSGEARGLTALIKSLDTSVDSAEIGAIIESDGN